MSLTSRQIALLRQLEFSQEHIATQLAQLEEKDLFAAIKQQKRKLSLKYHPDKTAEDALLTKKFLEIMAAAEELLNSKSVPSGVLDAIPPFAYSIPLDCIDQRIKEQIDDYFETISLYLNSLPSKKAQQQFIVENQTFFQFVLWLNQHSAEIRKVREEAFYQAVHAPSLLNTLEQNYNKLIIQFFAEENLSDIVYREAIALGDLSSILVLRKLISPIKWLCFIVCSVNDMLTTAFVHWLQGVIRDMSMDLASSESRVLPLLAKVTGCTGALVLPILMFPNLVVYMLVSPLLTRGLFYLANPINQVIRPLSEYFNVSQTLIGFTIAGLSVGAVGAVLFLSASMIEALLVLTAIVRVLTLIASALVLHKLYEQAPQVAIILGVVMASLTLIQLLIPIEAEPVFETLASVLLDLLSELSVLGINVLGYQQLSKVKENLSDLYVSLPWPEEAAPEVVKQVVDEVSQKNYWSHTLFNSPVQRNVPTAQDKMSWH